jgi:hypothetical protein
MSVTPFCSDGVVREVVGAVCTTTVAPVDTFTAATEYYVAPVDAFRLSAGVNTRLPSVLAARKDKSSPALLVRGPIRSREP